MSNYSLTLKTQSKPYITFVKTNKKQQSKSERLPAEFILSQLTVSAHLLNTGTYNMIKYYKSVR